jgi:hypothetical protein
LSKRQKLVRGGSRAIIRHRALPKSAGKTLLVLISEVVKINKEYYQSKILEAVVLPWAQQHFGNQQWTFQQDSAPVDKVRTTSEWCSPFSGFCLICGMGTLLT